MFIHHPVVWMLLWAVLAVFFIVFWFSRYWVSSANQPTTEREVEQVSVATTSRQIAEQRLINNVKPNGGFVYRYDPVTKSSPDSNNELRQLMATRLLGEIAKEDSTLYNLHRKNLDYMFSRYFKSSWDVARIEYSWKSKLWAIAMGVRALIASPFADEYSVETNKLAETILKLQESDGSFRAWRIAPTYVYDEDYLLTFYSWEAILALVELYLRTQEPKRLDAARRAQDFYITRYVEQRDEWYYPAYVPRHTMSLWHLWQITKDERYASAIYTLNDKLLDELLYTGTLVNYQGRFYNPTFPQYGTPHSSSDAVYTEGVAYAYALADERNDTAHKQKYRRALDLATKNLMNLQYTAQTIWPNFVEKKVLWAIRTNYEDMKVRVDTTQHMIDAFRAIEKFVRSE